MLKRGDTFGAYRIVARLKAGGMAQLYLARREGVAGFTRPVALKVIHPHLAREPEFVRMFIDEATLSSKVQDPNVVHVEDLGQTGGSLFLAMEYVHGIALANVLRAARREQRRLGPAFVAHVAAHVASGLHAAHETTDERGHALGIVHRDVSPQNILLAYKGHIKVIDFGVAKAASKRSEPEGAIHGKLSYMPPEQAKSEPIDRRADIYALGVVLWEMLVGRRLFEADNDVTLIERVRDPKIDRPSKHVAGIPGALDDLVSAMLSPDPNARPRDAQVVKKLALDAVPEARNVDASDVAALLRALVAEEIASQDKLLSDEAPANLAVAEDTASDLATTDRLVEPSDALMQFTMPAVMVRDLVAPPMVAEKRALLASAPPRSRGLLVFGLLALVALVGTALVVRGVAPPAASKESSVFPPAPALPTDEPPPAESALPTSSSSAPKPKPPTPTVRVTKRPPTPPPTQSAKGPHCRMVDGVQLCE